MSEEATTMKVDALAALEAAVREQTAHPVVPKVRVRAAAVRGQNCSSEALNLQVFFDQALGGNGEWVPVTFEGAARLLAKRAETIHLIESDHFNHGYEPPAWDEIDWEICKLRARNPGVVIQVLVCGANGSGKTFYACSRTMQFVANSRRELVWSYSLDEPNSKVINQKWMGWYLPNEYKTDRGSIKRTSTAKLNYNEAGGFTNNMFALHNGTTCEFRFYSKDITTLEGPRPSYVWMDEEFGDAWLDGVERRLLTHAGRTREHMPMWKALLKEKEEHDALRQEDMKHGRDARAPLKFPREKLPLLLVGAQLITFTPKSGYTPTVRAFVKGAVTVREVEATLLPIKDEAGQVTGCERMPKLQYCGRQNRMVYYLHAWDNPIGGNWQAMQQMAEGKPKKYVKWWCYGVAEATSGVIYPKFSRVAHCRPLWMLPREGSWFMTADPNQGGRNWTMSWTKVNALGEKFIAREWPQQDDHIPGEGYVGPWAEPASGKRVDGDPGPAQRTFGRGNKFIADEIARVERELYWVEGELERKRRNTETRRHGDGEATGKEEEFTWEMLKAPELGENAPRIAVAERFMDARAGNTQTMTHGASKTLIEVFDEDYKLTFYPVDKDHGAIDGSRRSVGHGAKLVEDALDYDEKLAVAVPRADGGTMLTFQGRAPRLYVCGEVSRLDSGPPHGCENHIFAFESWTNQDGGEGACKDFADLPRYLEMMDVRDMSGTEMMSRVRSTVGSQRSSVGEIGDWG